MQIEQLGPYRIGRKLGRGGMGTVFEATLIETGELAAIKLLSATLAHDDGFRDRFKAEIETLRKLRHPNIVRLFGFGEQEEYLYYSMELVDGRSLEDELQTGRRFAWREVTDFAVQTCRALKHAHDRGVIHRDIKPANLLLTPEGQIKLSDFGIAKLFGSAGMTAVGGVLGTAEYMAPEQTDGRPITPRCDLYSLGGVMYTLLAGRPPFKAATLVEMLQLQRYAEPDPVRRYAPDVPEELQFIVADLLVKDPEQRIATAMVLSRRLEAMRHGLSQRIDPILSAPTQAADIPPDVSVSSATMTAPGPPPAPLKPGSANISPEQYELAAPVSPHEVTAAIRRERALGVTIDLVSSTAAEKKIADKLPEVPPEEPAASFVKVSEEEHRRREATVEEPSHWRGLQTAVLLGAGALLGLGTWYLMQPASADRLYARVAQAARTGEISTLQSVDGEIKAFLQHYPNDSRAAEVRQYQDEVELYIAGRRAEWRARSAANVDSASPLERAYLEAMSHARLNPEVAEQRLQAIVALYDGTQSLDVSDQETLRLARKQWELLRGRIQQQSSEVLQVLTQRLDTADQLQQTDPTAARAIREAVVKLYGDKPWAARAVDRATAGLAARTAAEASSVQ
ncbi:MAG TPA: serine/threonine-protein kinase [Pirellulales bacterium]|jgi:serine/threonine-protein kinase